MLSNFIYSEDKWLETDRRAESIAIDHQLTAKLTLDAGVRHVHQSAGAVLSLSSSADQIALPGQAPVYATGSGLNPAGSGFWGTGAGLNPVTGQPQSFALNGQPIPVGNTSAAIDAFTVRGGAKYMAQENWSLGAEVGQDHGFANDPTWVAVNTDYRYEKGRIFARAETPTGRATAGADYRVLADTSVYGRWEQTNGLASSYALDSATKSQALVFGIRKSDTQGSENYSEMRMREGMNGQDLESASGIRNTISINERLKTNLMGERLKIIHGNGRGAVALGGGVEYNERLWMGTARLEWRQLEKSATALSDDTVDSWMNTLSLARKIDDSWTGLFNNYLLMTDNKAIIGRQLQNRFQLGAAYRPGWSNNFDALLRYENKYERNFELDDKERRLVNLISSNANYHPTRPLWVNGRFAGKSVSETLAGIADNYQAYLLSGRIVYDLNKDFDMGLMGSMLYSPKGKAKQYAYGAELGYLMQQNIWASVGYNLLGFTDKDLTGSDYTMEGLYLRLRMKFDEKDINKHTKVFTNIPEKSVEIK